MDAIIDDDVERAARLLHFNAAAGLCVLDVSRIRFRRIRNANFVPLSRSISRHASIFQLVFIGWRFDVVRQAGMQHVFFGSVLPTAPSIRGIQFTNCCLVSSHITAFVTGLQRRNRTLPPLSLNIEACTLTSHIISEIVRMVRTDCPVRTLHIGSRPFDASDAPLESLVSALDSNTYLQHLSFHTPSLGRTSAPFLRGWNTNMSAALASSHVERLNLEMPYRWTYDSRNAFFEGLIRNTYVHLQCLVLSLSFASEWLHELEIILTTYNITLRSIEVRLASFEHDVCGISNRLTEACRSNNCCVEAHKYLVELNYRVVQQRLWTRLLATIATKPHMIFKFLRRNLPLLYAKK